MTNTIDPFDYLSATHDAALEEATSGVDSLWGQRQTAEACTLAAEFASYLAGALGVDEYAMRREITASVLEARVASRFDEAEVPRLTQAGLTYLDSQVKPGVARAEQTRVAAQVAQATADAAAAAVAAQIEAEAVRARTYHVLHGMREHMAAQEYERGFTDAVLGTIDSDGHQAFPSYVAGHEAGKRLFALAAKPGRVGMRRLAGTGPLDRSVLFSILLGYPEFGALTSAEGSVIITEVLEDWEYAVNTGATDMNEVVKAWVATHGLPSSPKFPQGKAPAPHMAGVTADRNDPNDPDYNDFDPNTHHFDMYGEGFSTKQVDGHAVHTFESTAQAYNHTQTSDKIHDGDLLAIPSEHVYGFLHEAWPVAVTAEHGELHAVTDKAGFLGEFPEKADAWAAAEKLAAGHTAGFRDFMNEDSGKTGVCKHCGAAIKQKAGGGWETQAGGAGADICNSNKGTSRQYGGNHVPKAKTSSQHTARVQQLVWQAASHDKDFSADDVDTATLQGLVGKFVQLVLYNEHGVAADYETGRIREVKPDAGEVHRPGIVFRVDQIEWQREGMTLGEYDDPNPFPMNVDDIYSITRLEEPTDNGDQMLFGGSRIASIAWKGDTHMGADYLVGKASNGDIYEVYYNPNSNPTPCSWVNYGPKGDTGPNSGIASGRGFTTMAEAVKDAESHEGAKTAKTATNATPVDLHGEDLRQVEVGTLKPGDVLVTPMGGAMYQTGPRKDGTGEGVQFLYGFPQGLEFTVVSNDGTTLVATDSAGNERSQQIPSGRKVLVKKQSTKTAADVSLHWKQVIDAGMSREDLLANIPAHQMNDALSYWDKKHGATAAKGPWKATSPWSPLPDCYYCGLDVDDPNFGTGTCPKSPDGKHTNAAQPSWEFQMSTSLQPREGAEQNATCKHCGDPIHNIPGTTRGWKHWPGFLGDMSHTAEPGPAPWDRSASSLVRMHPGRTLDQSRYENVDIEEEKRKRRELEEAGGPLHESSMLKGAPFAGYADFDACVKANSDKGDPEAYCGSIKHKVEDKQASDGSEHRYTYPEHPDPSGAGHTQPMEFECGTCHHRWHGKSPKNCPNCGAPPSGHRVVGTRVRIPNFGGGPASIEYDVELLGPVDGRPDKVRIKMPDGTEGQIPYADVVDAEHYSWAEGSKHAHLTFDVHEETGGRWRWTMQGVRIPVATGTTTTEAAAREVFTEYQQIAPEPLAMKALLANNVHSIADPGYLWRLTPVGLSIETAFFSPDSVAPVSGAEDGPKAITVDHARHQQARIQEANETLEQRGTPTIAPTAPPKANEITSSLADGTLETDADHPKRDWLDRLIDERAEKTSSAGAVKQAVNEDKFGSERYQIIDRTFPQTGWAGSDGFAADHSSPAHNRPMPTNYQISGWPSSWGQGVERAPSEGSLHTAGWIDSARQVLEGKQFQTVNDAGGVIPTKWRGDEIDPKGEGMILDGVTASMLVAVYDALGPAQQAKFGAMPLMQAVNIGWKLVNRSKSGSRQAAFFDTNEGGSLDSDPTNGAGGGVPMSSRPQVSPAAPAPTPDPGMDQGMGTGTDPGAGAGGTDPGAGTMAPTQAADPSTYEQPTTAQRREAKVSRMSRQIMADNPQVTSIDADRLARMTVAQFPGIVAGTFGPPEGGPKVGDEVRTPGSFNVDATITRVLGPYGDGWSVETYPSLEEIPGDGVVVYYSGMQASKGYWRTGQR